MIFIAASLNRQTEGRRDVRCDFPQTRGAPAKKKHVIFLENDPEPGTRETPGFLAVSLLKLPSQAVEAMSRELAPVQAPAKLERSLSRKR